MPKVLALIPALLLFCGFAHAQTKQPYYFQTISNSDKTIDYVFGLYPGTATYFEGKDFPGYTAIRSAVFNRSKDTLKWSYFKVDILLKSGQLITNYSPFSKEGAYACNYNVLKDSTHYQFFCFHNKFASADIDKVWLQLSDDEIFGLSYEKNE